jgi:Mrp family chromosome partitioning ATPase
MKATYRDNPGVNDPTPPGLARVPLLVEATTEPTPALAEPLSIEYTSTRVVPDAWLRLQRHHGIVKPDRSELSESFRMLRNRVLLRMRSEGHRLLAVTSARPLEDKSLTAINLALTIAADYDTAVLLVDADLSGRGVQSLFGLAGAPGLADHLVQGMPLSDLLVNPGVPRFVLLPAASEPVLASAELLATRVTQQLVRGMRDRYRDRYIVVDLPPLLETADTMAFLPQVDTTLVVIEEHRTSLQDMERMNELLAPFNLIGTVMSKPRDPEPKAAPPRPWYRRLLARGR